MVQHSFIQWKIQYFFLRVWKNEKNSIFPPKNIKIFVKKDRWTQIFNFHGSNIILILNVKFKRCSKPKNFDVNWKINKKIHCILRDLKKYIILKDFYSVKIAVKLNVYVSQTLHFLQRYFKKLKLTVLLKKLHI